jgi:hypothetical protein
MIAQNASLTVPKLCSTCHCALEAHFDEILATFAATSSTTPTGSRQLLMIQQLMLMIKHHILDGDIGDNERLLEALRALKAKNKP